MTNLKGSMKLHRDLGISQKAAEAHRIGRPLPHGSKFSGPVDLHRRQGTEQARVQAVADEGLWQRVVGMKDRDTGQITSEVVESTDGPTLQES